MRRKTSRLIISYEKKVRSKVLKYRVDAEVLAELEELDGGHEAGVVVRKSCKNILQTGGSVSDRPVLADGQLPLRPVAPQPIIIVAPLRLPMHVVVHIGSLVISHHQSPFLA